MPTISSHHCSPVAMAKAVKKIDHLKLPPPPPIKDFLASISRLKDGQYGAEQYNAGSNEDGVFMGEFFDDGELDDYAVAFTVALKCLQFFLEAADLLKSEYNSCDDFFLAWSRFEAGSDPRGHLGVTWGVYLCAGKPPLADIILSTST